MDGSIDDLLKISEGTMLEATYKSEFTPAKWEKRDGRWFCIVEPNGQEANREVDTTTVAGKRLSQLLDSNTGGKPCQKVSLQEIISHDLE